MKTLLILLAITSTAAAQDFQYRRSVSWFYSESVPYNDYGYGNYGYRPFFPTYRYQMQPIRQTYYPMNWGAIPGAVSNGYFIPNYYDW